MTQVHLLFRPLAVLVFLSAALVLSGCADQEPPQQQAGEAPGNPAIAGLTEKIRENPQDPQLYAARAEVYYKNEGYDEAIQDLRQALRLDSTHVEHYHLLADVYLDYFKSRLALKTMERAAALYPERIPTLLKLAEFQMILKQHEASLRTIDRILRIDPNEAEAFFMFGMNFKQMGDTARAINSFQEAVELDARLLDGWINLGQLQAAKGNAIAERYFNTALEINPRSINALHAKADYLGQQERFEEALATYRKIVRIDPQYEEAHYNSGLIYLNLDSLQQAYRRFDMAIQTYPLHVRAYYFRGLSAEMMGDIARARQDYEQALRLVPDYTKARKALERLKALQ